MFGPLKSNPSPNDLRQYDTVRVVALVNKKRVLKAAECRLRPPRVADQAVILEIYSDPLAYNLECCDESGRTIWWGTFACEDLLIAPFA